jgi:hypothetical protein
MLFRAIFLSFLGIGLFGMGVYFGVKTTNGLGWLGTLTALGGALIFLFGFGAIVALLYQTCWGLSA